eukprot:173991-Pelagomonas_calceolata.AAC.1
MQQQKRQAAAEIGSREWHCAHGGTPSAHDFGLTRIIWLSSSTLCTSSDNMALASQKEHDGRVQRMQQGVRRN